MGILREKGIIKGSKNKTASIFENLFPDENFLSLEYSSPSDYVSKYWNKYKELQIQNNATNGKLFELTIYTLLYREGLVPFYSQAKVAFVPNVEYDTILYTKEKPISLSLKTSLRERYKQADLEAVALKYVHRKAKCFLLSIESSEVESISRKIMTGDILGLDNIIDCQTHDFDALIEWLKNDIKSILSVSEKIDVITGNLIR